VSIVLVIDDDPHVRRFLRTALSGHGHVVHEAATIAEGLAAFERYPPGLVLLDLGLPDGDGLAVLRSIRPDSRVPVIVLSARGQEGDKVAALDSGADDYLTKPFGNGELVARVEALLRRPGGGSPAPDVYDDGRMRLDPSARTVLVDGAEVRLSATEFRLLAMLARNRGRVISPGQLLDRVWGDPTGVGPERVKFAVLRLRRRLGWADPTSSPIESVRGMGYRYRP
jgi:DNA-binding response OmpR family regulator